MNVDTVGTTPLTGETIFKLLQEKGMDFQAVKHPIPNVANAYRDADNNLVIPARDVDTGLFTVQHGDKIFNAGVKRNYEVLQYLESFSKLQEIAKVTDAELISGGLWNKGAEDILVLTSENSKSVMVREIRSRSVSLPSPLTQANTHLL